MPIQLVFFLAIIYRTLNIIRQIQNLDSTLLVERERVSCLPIITSTSHKIMVLACIAQHLLAELDLEVDVLYNFIDATSQLIKDDSVTPLRDPQKNIHCFFKF